MRKIKRILNAILIAVELSLILLMCLWIFCNTAEARETILSEEIVEICKAEGLEHDVDQYLIMAYCEIESRGIPDVISDNGQYYGLMQLNKDTFEGDLLDPIVNVSNGAEYLAYLRSYYDGDMWKACSVYCGEGGRIGKATIRVMMRCFELQATYLFNQEVRTI